MEGGPGLATLRWRFLRKLWPWFFLIGLLGLIRWSKGSGFADFYAVMKRPFWPGPAQREWVEKAVQLEQQVKLKLLEEDNQRLRKLLSLQNSSVDGIVSAPVISRYSKGWWQQLQLGQGSISGISVGDAVLGPGGLLGVIHSVTPTTARVRLLTAHASRIGVWVIQAKSHGVLVGMGTTRPQLNFLVKDPKVKPGDLVSTSPASTILPPNLPIGVIQTINNQALPAPTATVQLIAPSEAIDWVQVKKSS